MTERYFTLISKYALLLSLFYALEFAFSEFWVSGYFQYFDSDAYNLAVSTFTRIFLGFILNIVTAVLVNRDIKKLNLNTKYVILATVLYRPIGVCAFLLFAILDKNSKEGVISDSHGRRL